MHFCVITAHHHNRTHILS